MKAARSRAAHRELGHVLAALVRHRAPADVERRLLARLDELDECGVRFLSQVVCAQHPIACDGVIKDLPVGRRRVQSEGRGREAKDLWRVKAVEPVPEGVRRPLAPCAHSHVVQRSAEQEAKVRVWSFVSSTT